MAFCMLIFAGSLTVLFLDHQIRICTIMLIDSLVTNLSDSVS